MTNVAVDRTQVTSRAHRLRKLTVWVAPVPFLGFVALFLALPVLIVIVSAFRSEGGGFTLDNVEAVGTAHVLTSFINSLLLAAASTVVGSVLGALLSYVVALGRRDGIIRRVVVAGCSVLALFGGVTLAFAFIATLGQAGLVTEWLVAHGVNIYANGVWLYDLPGLTLVYVYFQVPLMVLVFLPAVDAVKPQWREVVESLGGSTWQYWRLVGGPLLAPAFMGSFLLLFANAYSAYATAAALINQGGIIVPLQISNALTSEVAGQQEQFADALALAMIVIVAVLMLGYAQVQRRVTRWLEP